MNRIYRICGKISILFYVFVLFQIWHLCQYGMNRKYLLMLAFGTLGFLLSFIFWLYTRKYQHKKAKIIFRIQIIIIVISTVYFGGRIVYSAIPYNGALSWKLDEWMWKKTVRLQHDNFFEDGPEGILLDLDAALELPEELYIADQYQMTFDATGAVGTINTFLYGRNKKGETETYLVTYDADVDEYMTVWMNGEANETYDKDMCLEPMLAILQAADCQDQVEAWYTERGPETYEILYYGRRSFTSEEGLRYLGGDADGDGAVNGISSFE